MRFPFKGGWPIADKISRKASPWGYLKMKRKLRYDHFENLYGYDGKGTAGCMISVLLLLVAVFVGIKLIPIYYSNSNFESAVKTEASRAGAHFFDDDTIIKDVLDLAKRNDIRIKRDNIKVERFNGQVHLYITYSVPVDFVFYQRNLIFNVKSSSLIGSL